MSLLQSATSDVATHGKAPIAQLRRMTRIAKVFKRRAVNNKRATLLDMPREIRDLIYHHIYPEPSSSRSVVPVSAVVDETGHQVLGRRETLVKKKATRMERRNLVKHVFAPLVISRQIRDEILPIFHQNYVFKFVEEDGTSLKCNTWLQSLHVKQLKLVRNVDVTMYTRGYYLPVPWLRAEEKITTLRGSKLSPTLEFLYETPRYLWVLAYMKCHSMRSAGLTWDQINSKHNEMSDPVFEKAIEITNELEERWESDLEDQSD